MDIFSLVVSVSCWWCLGNSGAAGSPTRAALVSPSIFLTSLIGRLRILLLVAGNDGSEQQLLLQTLLPYINVFLCQLFISYI